MFDEMAKYKYYSFFHIPTINLKKKVPHQSLYYIYHYILHYCKIANVKSSPLSHVMCFLRNRLLFQSICNIYEYIYILHVWHNQLHCNSMVFLTYTPIYSHTYIWAYVNKNFHSPFTLGQIAGLLLFGINIPMIGTITHVYRLMASKAANHTFVVSDAKRKWTIHSELHRLYAGTQPRHLAIIVIPRIDAEDFYRSSYLYVDMTKCANLFKYFDTVTITAHVVATVKIGTLMTKLPVKHL